jgi:hypothetical protein
MWLANTTGRQRRGGVVHSAPYSHYTHLRLRILQQLLKRFAQVCRQHLAACEQVRSMT